MTMTSDLIAYYQNLLIIQYNNKPKALATIGMVVNEAILSQQDTTQPTLPAAVQDAFNLLGSDTAVGVQLDTLGKYAGVTRNVQGFTSVITLDDADFLTLIRFAIALNTSGSSLADIQALLAQFFPGEVFVFDLKTMRLQYLISASVGSQDLVQVLISENLLPRPMGVRLSVVYAPNVTNFFGFRTYKQPAHNATPFNSYQNYNTTWKWLSYQNGVSP